MAMTWWTSTPSLTAVAAWDALRVVGNRLTDGVGVNHITLTADVEVDTFRSVKALGNGNWMTLATPVPMPSNGVVVALWSIARRNVLLQGTPGAGGGYLFHQNDTDFRWYSHNDAQLLSNYGADTAHRLGLNFAAVVNSAGTSRLYLNGQYFGAPLPLANVMSQIAIVGYNSATSEYNLGADEGLSALGVLTGTPTLAELQALEAIIRAALGGQPPAIRALIQPTGRAGNPPPQALTPMGVLPVQRVVAPYFADAGVINGTVKEKNQPANTPLKRKVQLFDGDTSVLLAETWSNPATGEYAFKGLALTKFYTVVSYDHTGLYRAVIANNQTAVTL